MALQVSSHTVTPIAQTINAPAPTSRTGRIAPTAKAQQVDTVKLSLASQVHQLKSQGQNAKQIAANLGVAATDVSSHLAATTSKQTALPVPSPDPETHNTAARVVSSAPSSEQ